MSRHGKRRTGTAGVTQHAVNTHVIGSLRVVTGHHGTSSEKFFLNRFISDFYSRRRATVEEHWTRSLRFLSTELANAAFTRDGAEVAAMAAGTADTEHQVEQVVLRIHPAPEAPHGATADFDLVHFRQGQETLRERWSITLRFTFLTVIPSELVVYNPMGILITYLQADRALVTEQPPARRRSTAIPCPGSSAGASLPYVAACLAVAARPPERRRRSGAFGRRRERPPLWGCLDRGSGWRWASTSFSLARR